MSTAIGPDSGAITSQTAIISPEGGGRIVYELLGSADNPTPPATFNGAFLNSTTVTTEGGKKTVTAEYTDRLKKSVGSMDATAQEIPIRQHPDCDNPEDLDDPPVINGVAKPGVESFLSPGVVYQKQTFQSSVSFANFDTKIGKRDTPSGISSGGGGWLKTGVQITENRDGSGVKVESWLWSPTGWDTKIYST